MEWSTFFVNRYSSKVYAVFQRIDGIDVFVLAMYVQEIAPSASAPNAGCAYIAYLDSGIEVTAPK